MEGFGKLYGEDADHLAEIIAQFPRRSFAARVRMLLFCFASLYEREGAAPYFNVGSRQIAEFAGCAHKTARRFLADMEADGVIVRLGTMKTRAGEFTKRTFWWLEGGRVCPKSSTPRGTKPRAGSTGVGSKTKGSDPTSEAELQNSGEAARAAIAARFAERERMWGDGE